MASLAEIQSLVQQIHQDLPVLIQRARINPQQVVLIEGVADLSKRLGLIMAGEFRAGNDKEPGFGFTGGRYGYPGFSYGGTTYFLAGVSNDALQVGLSLADGKIYFGGGAGWQDTNGISILSTSNPLGEADKSYKFVDTNGNITVWLYNYYPAGDNFLYVQTNPITGRNSTTFVIAAAPSGKGAQATLQASASAVTNINVIADAAGTTSIDMTADSFDIQGAVVINEAGADKDTRIEGDTDVNLTVWDAGLDAIGIGGAAQSGYKLKIHGNVNLSAASDLYRNGVSLSDSFDALNGVYAPIAKGVTNGDTHDHNGGDGAQIAYSSLSGALTQAAGTYAPTCTNVSNMDASSAVADFTYLRVGNVVIVSGNLNADATTAGVLSVFRVSLPVSSNFGSSGDLTGTGGIQGSDDVVIAQADTTNDQASVNYTPAGTANTVIRLLFMYRVI